jgi:hypothetical protein
MKARRHNTSATQKGNLMQITKQLAVFLHNKPGTLAGMCRELGKNRINIHALSVSDTVDHAVVRMVVNDPMRASFLLGEHGVLVVESEVLVVDLPNEPGALSDLADHLAEHKINIEYAYAAASPNSKKSAVILRVSDAKKAARLLGSAVKKKAK